MPSSSSSSGAALVDAECLGLPAGAVEGEHELARAALPQRVRGGEPLQLRTSPRAGPSARSASIRSSRASSRSSSSRADLGAAHGRVGELGERRPAPQRQRLAQQRRPRPLRRPAPQPGRPGARSGRVQRAGRRQPVAGRAGDDQRRVPSGPSARRSAETRPCRGVRRRPGGSSPQTSSTSRSAVIVRARVHEQVGEQRALLGRPAFGHRLGRRRAPRGAPGPGTPSPPRSRSGPAAARQPAAPAGQRRPHRPRRKPMYQQEGRPSSARAAPRLAASCGAASRVPGSRPGPSRPPHRRWTCAPSSSGLSWPRWTPPRSTRSGTRTARSSSRSRASGSTATASAGSQEHLPRATRRRSGSAASPAGATCGPASRSGNPLRLDGTLCHGVAVLEFRGDRIWPRDPLLG